MATIETLRKLNEVMARLLKGQTYTGVIGSIGDPSVWANAVPNIKNGNTLAVAFGPGENQVQVEASALVITDSGAAIRKLELIAPQNITSVLTPPIGARTDGTNFFFSEVNPHNETVVLMAGFWNHIYAAYDPAKPNDTGLAVISTTSEAAPGPTLEANIGPDPSLRQAVCFVDSGGDVTVLKSFPAVFAQVAAVTEDAPASFANRKKAAISAEHNALKLVFTFPEGTGTGEIGEVAVKLGADVLAYLPISPQLSKDIDVELVVTWNLMIGDPGSFI